MQGQTIQFSKMHGTGNDFVVIDAISQKIELDPQQIRFIADRHVGIGCDQLLLVEASTTADFRYRIFNADGNEVEQCGNGARCFARFVHDRQMSNKKSLCVETLGGTIHLQITADNQVTVDMGEPRFSPTDLPFISSSGDNASNHYTLEIDGKQIVIGIASVGNPHAVIVVEDLTTAPVATLGPAIGRDPSFPEGVNVGFMQIVSRDHIRLRVFERGAGETQACGTGACAAVAIAHQRGELDNNVTVELTGGTLAISCSNSTNTLQMSGPTTHVFEGTIDL